MNKFPYPPSTILSFLVLLVLFASVIIGLESETNSSRATQAEQTAPTSASQQQPQSRTVGFLRPTAPLSQEEIRDLRFMREEEKLARDVYSVLFQKWQLPIFQNIAQAEHKHTSAVLNVINRYGISDPAAGKPAGVYADAHLTKMYKDLIAKGQRSVEDALWVGGIIEEVDIDDLDKAISRTQRGDIIRVYRNIQLGSRNHLRGFAKSLAGLGRDYKPQHLPLESVTQILAGPMENNRPF
ncbi:DUF2202 domain-containing protein [Terasakiella sp. SH-1]|uniref:DUF2202 domain-containing protein n=1 Tax=Terasakiella sp. SH-1 TaxID=2560057 RepID=UPI0010740BF3|nr:DUF2202 domain-containing protein [Terasakiella sp. SH-1]